MLRAQRCQGDRTGVSLQADLISLQARMARRQIILLVMIFELKAESKVLHTTLLCYCTTKEEKCGEK